MTLTTLTTFEIMSIRNSRRRSSIEAIQSLVKEVHQSPAEHARERRLSLTMMNCIWARNTDVETSDPVTGEITGKNS